jgi:hypothetical protein
VEEGKGKKNAESGKDKMRAAIASLRQSKNLQHLDLGIGGRIYSSELLDVALACKKIHTVKPVNSFCQSDIDKLIKARKGTLRELDLDCGVAEKELLFSLAECTKLEKLKFTPHFDSIKILTSLESLNELCLTIPEEETLDFEPFLDPNSLPQISRLEVLVYVDSADAKNCLIALANACPNLRYLNLQLEDLSVNRSEQVMHEFITKCPKLEVIQCYCEGKEDGKPCFFLDQEFENIRICLPNLKILCLHGDFVIPRESIKEMMLSSKNKLAIKTDSSLFVQASTTAHEIAQLPLLLDVDLRYLKEIITF